MSDVEAVGRCTTSKLSWRVAKWTAATPAEPAVRGVVSDRRVRVIVAADRPGLVVTMYARMH
jgi:hypothetical protein